MNAWRISICAIRWQIVPTSLEVTTAPVTQVTLGMALLTVQVCDMHFCSFISIYDKYVGNLVLTDVDECVLGVHNCDVNANCTNTVGSFNCSCNMGYSGNGVNCSKCNICAISVHVFP